MTESPTPAPNTTQGRALVLGATGIVKQSVTRRLVDAGWQADGLSRTASPRTRTYVLSAPT